MRNEKKNFKLKLIMETESLLCNITALYMATLRSDFIQYSCSLVLEQDKMATSSTSSFESNEKSKENIKLTSEVSDTSLLNSGQNIVRDSGGVRRDMPLSDPESNKADSSDTMNSSEGDIRCDNMVLEHSEAIASSQMSLTNESRRRNYSDPCKNLFSCDEEEKIPEKKDGVEGTSAVNVRFENTYETDDVQDETDGSFITKIAVWVSTTIYFE